MLVHKCSPHGEHKYSYVGQLSSRTAHGAVVRAPWAFPEMVLPYVTFNPGDIFTETFYEDRWYNVFEINSNVHALKGWYGNVTHPARISADSIEWDDLALDVWMTPDGIQHVLDEDEFETMKRALSSIEMNSALGGLAQLKDELGERWRAYANAQIASALTARQWTLGTAESCTGGLIGDVITNRAGSSAYFQGGIISYSNDVKERLLGVRRDTLIQHGAVSAQCALEMARGVRQTLGVDVGISATGIAGPDGGSAAKPVGLVYIGLSTPDLELANEHVWPGDRKQNKGDSADQALRLLLEHIATPSQPVVLVDGLRQNA